MTTLRTMTHEYDDRGTTYEGYLAVPDGGPRPVVMVAHAWGGLGQVEMDKADAIAREFGFAAFAIDLYGKGKRGSSPEENEALMMPLVNDRAELAARLQGAVAASKTLPDTDSSRRAAIGYCFGGLCVLDMARAGMDIAGVASLHGLLKGPGTPTSSVTSKVLALHGWDDPMVPPDDVIAFSEEMTTAGADWQLHAFGGVKHSFSNPTANNLDMGTIYDADADRRSWVTLGTFLTEVLGTGHATG